MSAFVCILERRGDTVDPDDLNRLASPLDIYGSQTATFCRGPLGIAVRHGGGPGARDRHGPLEDLETGRVVAVTGSFAPVADGLRDAAERTERRFQPAAWAAQLLAHPPRDDAGEEGVAAGLLGGVSGAFVFIVGRPGSGSIEIVRDHLGSSKVYYRLDQDRLIAASEPAAILCHGAISNDLDEGSIARFLGFRFGLSERSFFQAVRELPPAHRLRVTPTEARAERFWRFRPPPAVERPPEEIATVFRLLLTRAIVDDMAGLDPSGVALSLSGGLDSTALAALAPRGVKAFSWTFNETPTGDERRRIEQVSRHLDLSVHWVSGDGLHPFCDDFTDRFVDENSPYLNPFSALKHRLYQAARKAGCERVLVGDGGDALFAASEYWLRDALVAGEPRALQSLAGTIGRAARGDRFARRALGRALGVSRYPSALRRHPAPWLTTFARSLLGEERPSPILPPGEDPTRHELSVGVKHSEIESEEQRLFARCGVERANPFWSWPLLELTIHLSAHWYHRDARSKVLTREAFRGLLPEEVVEGGRTGSLGDFFLRGLAMRREELRDTVFLRPRSDWPRYVRREWVAPFLSATESIAFGHTILWRVISYELWYRRRLQGRPQGEARPDRECRVGRGSEGEGKEADTAGVVYGVAIRGRLPSSFRPYLLPAVDRAGRMDFLEVSYRQIDELPEVEEIWASEPTASQPSAGGRFALVRQEDGFGLLVSDQGHGFFDCGRRRIGIAWTAGGTGAPHYFFSYALPLWLEFRGVPVLHGSAVSIGDQAVGFVGPSGVGKSVLAADLARVGYGLLADDGLVLRRNGAGGWLAFQGPPVVRLWPSALRLLEIPARGLARVHETLDKRQFSPQGVWGGSPRDVDGDSRAGGVRLAVVYILEHQSEGSTPKMISKLAPGEALVRLIEHSVAAAPAAALGLSARRFELLADVVENVPVRCLRLPRGADSAIRVREAILGDLERAR